MHPLMRRLLTLAIALLSLGELALAQWAVLAWRDSILPLGQALALLLVIAGLNAVVFPLLRTRLRGTGPVQWLSRAWVLTSVAALFTAWARHALRAARKSLKTPSWPTRPAWSSG